MISATIFLVALETILFPVFHILFNFQFTLNSLWLLSCNFAYSTRLLFDLEYLLATMALGLKNREIILSVLLISDSDSTLIMAVKSSIILLNQLPDGSIF